MTILFILLWLIRFVKLIILGNIRHTAEQHSPGHPTAEMFQDLEHSFTLLNQPDITGTTIMKVKNQVSAQVFVDYCNCSSKERSSGWVCWSVEIIALDIVQFCMK